MAELEQRPDTIDALLARISDLESARDASRAQVADLAAALAALEERLDTVQTQRDRDVSDLRGALAALLDSVAAARADLGSRLEGGITSLRSEAESRTRALATRVDGIADDVVGVEAELGASRTEVYDSIGVARDAIAAEQEYRRAADSRSAMWVVIVAAAFLVAVGVVWWRSERRATSVGKRVDAIRPALDRKLASVQEEVVTGSNDQARQLLHEQLMALERISAVLAAVEETRSQESAPAAPEPDHDLAIGVCNELNRIENLLLSMDSKLRGHKQLRGCVRRVKENMHVEGYEITELRGRQYSAGMHVDADFVEDEDMEPDQMIISRVTRPEVRYQDTIIQNAAVKVSMGF